MRFCCQHCGQGYLGNGPDGHPEPRRFSCAFCGEVIDSDGMVLEPGEGETEPDSLPWVETRRGWHARWGLTAWLGWRDPERLVGLIPAGMGARPAVVYGVLTQVGAAVVFGVVVGVGAALLSLPSGVGVGWVARVLVVLALSVLLAAGWAAVLRQVSRRRGRDAGWVRSVQVVCLLSGPQALWLVPGLGLWVGWIGTAVWARSVSRVVAKSHGLRGRPGRLAGWACPVGCVGLWVLVSVGGAVGWLPDVGPPRPVWFTHAGASVGRFDGPIRDLAAQHGGLRHAAELLADGRVGPGAFCGRGSKTGLADVEVAGTSLAAFDGLSTARQLAVVQQAVAGRDASAPAHRLGDFVFVFGALGADVPGLWLVIEAWDPAANPADGTVHVLHADGSVRTVLPGDVGEALLEQNRLRVSLGLRVLEDPRRVRAD